MNELVYAAGLSVYHSIHKGGRQPAAFSTFCNCTATVVLGATHQTVVKYVSFSAPWLAEYKRTLWTTDIDCWCCCQVDELIKTTEAAYASEEMPKEVTAAQKALRQHNEGRYKLQQLINFTSDEADQIIIRVRQQVRHLTYLLTYLLRKASTQWSLSSW